MAAISKRRMKGGRVRYRARVRLRGQSRSGTFSLKADAQHWASDLEREILRKELSPLSQSKEWTLSQLVKRYAGEVLNLKARRSRAVQEPRLQFWVDFLGDIPLLEVTAPRVSEGKKQLEPRGAATINGYLAVLSHAFTVAVKEWRWVDFNPVKNVRRLPEPQGRVRFLTSWERRLLLRCCEKSSNPFLHILVVLALSTGARKEELRSLTWGQVDLHRGKIYLDKTKNKTRRPLFLFGTALELMTQLQAERGRGSLCFPSSREPNKPIDFRYAWEKALDESGIENFCFHDLRHSAASYLAMNGATLNDIAEILGHKSLEMARRYSHLTDSHSSQVVEKMNRAML